MKKHKDTYHEGASDERTAILAHVRILKRLRIYDFDDLIAWILQRNERYNKRKGGLGRHFTKIIKDT